MVGRHGSAAAGLLEQRRDHRSIKRHVPLDQQDILIEVVASVPEGANVVGRLVVGRRDVVDVDAGEARANGAADHIALVADHQDRLSRSLRGKLPERALEKRLTSDRDHALGESVRQRFQAGPDARGKDHRTADARPGSAGDLAM